MGDILETLEKQAASLQGTVNELMARFDRSTKFDEAAWWDRDAQAVIRLFEQYKESLTKYCKEQEQTLTELKLARTALPFFKRVIAARGDEKSLEDNIAQAAKGIASVDKAIDTLYDLVDRTPTSKGEQTQMLKELRQQKKELAVQKRSINENMRAARTKTRQEMSEWTGVQGGMLGDVARMKRASIRRQKETALHPQENARAAIERQLIEIDKRFTWVSRFSGDDPHQEDVVVRCAYCGRRVEPDKVCPGCGSDYTIRSL